MTSFRSQQSREALIIADALHDQAQAEAMGADHLTPYGLADLILAKLREAGFKVSDDSGGGDE